MGSIEASNVADTRTGRVFNIQRYSLHDGPGIRTLVFLKGCPLGCLWCSNPESQRGEPELGFIESRCVGTQLCGNGCIEVCLAGAMQLSTLGKPVINRQACNACGLCAAKCTKEALKIVGQDMTVAQIMEEVEKDRPFYRRSGGGVTVGGGEPLAQWEFAAGLLAAIQGAYLHTALETCGHGPWHHLEQLLRQVDTLYIDFKQIDPVKHKELTGHSNELILSNLRRVGSVKSPKDVVVRIPIIPGYNDSEDNITGISEAVGEFGFHQVELIPYHRFGVSKYAQYGIDYRMDESLVARGANLNQLKQIVARHGLTEISDRG
jgi:pyruvate formate lyase activating enzyme